MKLLIAGDFCPNGGIAPFFERNEFSLILKDVQYLIDGADFSVINLECPVVVHNAQPIDKCGPNLKCSPKTVSALKWAGFNCVSLANNHFFDFGEEGVIDTLDVCRNNGIDYVGGGIDLAEASSIFYKQIKDEVLAIINCCEHESSIASADMAGSNPLNPIKQFYKIQEAREKADYVLVIVHGGHEHYNLPSPRMVETYRFFIDAGADTVVNHHQHCYSGYEVYKKKPIFYGLGNFCFGKVHEDLSEAWNEGYIVELNYEDNGHVYYKLIPYNQCKEKPTIELMKDEDYTHFFENINELNSIISDPSELKKRHEEWMEATGNSFEHQFLPYSNRWLLSAYIRHLFPSFLSKKKLLNLQNHLECESHRERSLFALNKLLKKY